MQMRRRRRRQIAGAVCCAYCCFASSIARRCWTRSSKIANHGLRSTVANTALAFNATRGHAHVLCNLHAFCFGIRYGWHLVPLSIAISCHYRIACAMPCGQRITSASLSNVLTHGLTADARRADGGAPRHKRPQCHSQPHAQRCSGSSTAAAAQRPPPERDRALLRL